MFDLKQLDNWLLPLLWTLQIFYFSSLPRGSYPKIDEQHFDTGYVQYLYHFAQFFCLSLLVYRAMLRSSVSAKTADRRGHVLKHALIVIAVIAFLDELIQIPVPTRTFTTRDLMANLAGGGVGLLSMQIGRRSKDLHRHELHTKADR
jgi:VanZ family protein